MPNAAQASTGQVRCPWKLLHPSTRISHTIVTDRPAAWHSGDRLMGFRTKDNVGVGSKAPDFTLPSQSDELVNLGDFLGEKPVVMV
jgi:hypothetical protein